MQDRLLYWLVAVSFLAVASCQHEYKYLENELNDQNDQLWIQYSVFKTQLRSDPSMVSTAFDKNVSSDCYEASRQYLRAIKHYELWALKSKCQKIN